MPGALPLLPPPRPAEAAAAAGAGAWCDIRVSATAWNSRVGAAPPGCLTCTVTRVTDLRKSSAWGSWCRND